MQFIRATHVAGIVLLSLWIASCIGWGDCRDRWESKGYNIADCEHEGNVFLTHEDYNSDLVAPTVFAVGSDSKYIVVKQHPARLVGYALQIDRSVTNYFIVERVAGNFRDGVRGPLGESEFMALKEELSSPEFSKTFRDLE